MRYLLYTALLLTCLAVAGCNTYTFVAQSDLSETVDHVTGSAVDVRTRNGTIIIAADQSLTDEVIITAKVKTVGTTQQEADDRLANVSLHIERMADQTLVVSPRWPDKPRGSDACSFEIRLPDADGVIANSSNGRIRVTDLSGDAVLDTSNGQVIVEGHSGDVTIHSSNGRITCRDITGSCDIDTSNGRLELVNLSGPVRGHTSNGSVILQLDHAAEAGFEIHTSNGAITAKVPPGWGGTVDARTSNGRVQIKGMAEVDKISDDHVKLWIGEGEAVSRIRTSNGSIAVEIKAPEDESTETMPAVEDSEAEEPVGSPG